MSSFLILLFSFSSYFTSKRCPCVVKISRESVAKKHKKNKEKKNNEKKYRAKIYIGNLLRKFPLLRASFDVRKKKKKLFYGRAFHKSSSTTLAMLILVSLIESSNVTVFQTSLLYRIQICNNGINK